MKIVPREAYDDQYFNNTLSVLRDVLALGGLRRDQNPAFKVQRLGVKPTELHLPEPDQFTRMIEAVETSGAGHQKACGDLVRFPCIQRLPHLRGPESRHGPM